MGRIALDRERFHADRSYVPQRTASSSEGINAAMGEQCRFWGQVRFFHKVWGIPDMHIGYRRNILSKKDDWFWSYFIFLSEKGA